MLKFVDACVLKIVGVQNFVDKLGLNHNFGDVCNACNSADLFVKIGTGA